MDNTYSPDLPRIEFEKKNCTYFLKRSQLKKLKKKLSERRKPFIGKSIRFECYAPILDQIKSK